MERRSSIAEKEIYYPLQLKYFIITSIVESQSCRKDGRLLFSCYPFRLWGRLVLARLMLPCRLFQTYTTTFLTNELSLSLIPIRCVLLLNAAAQDHALLSYTFIKISILHPALLTFWWYSNFLIERKWREILTEFPSTQSKLQIIVFTT